MTADHWTLDHGQLTHDGIPILFLTRTVWGENYTPANEIAALESRIVALLNAAEADPTAAHPYLHPSTAINGACLDCGKYEEDGPHIAATV